jgi:hypothetical protein
MKKVWLAGDGNWRRSKCSPHHNYGYPDEGCNICFQQPNNDHSPALRDEACRCYVLRARQRQAVKKVGNSRKRVERALGRKRT